MSDEHKFCSIIVTHHSPNEDRSNIMQRSLLSLAEVINYPYELIVIDNGGSETDSSFLMQLADRGVITTYVKNARNMHFGYARGQGISLAQGDYIAIIDNDILHKKDWITRCIKILEDNPDKKWYGTPLDYPQDAKYNGIVRYRAEKLMIDGEECSLNTRAGSNAFVIRLEDLREIGGFPVHRIAGTKWTDRAVRKFYKALVLPNGYAEDVGLRIGYNLNEIKPVFIEFKDGTKVHFNRDEIKFSAPNLRDQRTLL